MPKPVRNPFKILAPLRLGALALKFYSMVTAKDKMLVFMFFFG